MALMYTEDDLRKVALAAYISGFDESAEGFNGEYVGRRWRENGALDRELERRFIGWWAGR